MTSENKTNYALIFIVTLAGWGVTFGVSQQKIETNWSDIQRIEKQHESAPLRLWGIKGSPPSGMRRNQRATGTNKGGGIMQKEAD